MNKDEIILSVFNDKELKSLAGKYDVNGDLWSELMLYLCEMDAERIEHIYSQGFMRYHVVSCITRSSLMYQNYVKHERKLSFTDEPIGVDIEDSIYNELIEISGKEINKDELVYLINHIAMMENTYDRELFLLITQGVDLGNGEFRKFNTISEISKETGISYTTLYNSYKKTIKRINEKVTHIINSRRSA